MGHYSVNRALSPCHLLTHRQKINQRPNHLTFMKFQHLTGKCLTMALMGTMALGTVSCSDNDFDLPTHNDIDCITDANKLAIIYSMKDLDGAGRLYEINYTEDYKLDEVLQSGKTKTEDLFTFVASLLYDKMPSHKMQLNYGAGCSAFAVPRTDGIGFLMGRNYDYRHFTDDKKSYIPTAAILVHTAPQNGKKSISMVDGMQMGYHQGFYTDGSSDLSMLMGLPYDALDGINEDGFAIGVLALNEKPTKPYATPCSTKKLHAQRRRGHVAAQSRGAAAHARTHLADPMVVALQPHRAHTPPRHPA